MNTLTRRQLLLKGAVASVLVAPLSLQSKSLGFLAKKPLNPGLTKAERFRLMRAVMDVLETYYSGVRLQFWNLPLEKIDFEKRLTNIIYWVDLAVRDNQYRYDVDPAWILSQIMAESLFYELAISPSMAVGICQFMPNTASRDYQMVIAGSKQSHARKPYLKTELAGSLTRYYALIREKNEYRKKTKAKGNIDLNKALKWLAEGDGRQQQAQQQLDRNSRLQEYNQLIHQAKKEYIDYMVTNITELGERDIFKQTAFFTGFDERFTYRKPINAMVAMIANALRVRNGNILTAAAAYNAGLSRTWTNEVLYTQYGMMPPINETSQYLSRIVANYEEIVMRYRT